MAAPLDAPWNNNTLSDANLGEVTVGKGTSFPSTWEVGRMFLRTDEPLLYYNSGTEGTPVWSAVIGESAEKTTTPVTDDGNGTGLNQWLFTDVGTIGTAGKLYLITHIEMKGGGSTSGNTIFCAFIRHSSGVWQRIATSEESTLGASTTEKKPVAGTVFRGGQTILLARNADTGAGNQIRFFTDSSAPHQLTETYSNKPSDVIVGTENSITTHIYAKMYYREYI